MTVEPIITYLNIPFYRMVIGCNPSAVICLAVCFVSRARIENFSDID